MQNSNQVVIVLVKLTKVILFTTVGSLSANADDELAKFAAEVRHFYSNTSHALFSSLLDAKLHVLVELTDDFYSSRS
jgi:hypothetical protein